MHKARSSSELFTSLNWVAKNLKLDRKLVHYWAVKFKLRTFVFFGMRMVEYKDLLFLVNNLNARLNVNQEGLEKIRATITG